MPFNFEVVGVGRFTNQKIRIFGKRNKVYGKVRISRIDDRFATIAGRVTGYLRILFAILFAIITNRVPNSRQIAPPNLNGMPM